MRISLINFILIFLNFYKSSCEISVVFHDQIRDCSKEMGEAGGIMDFSNFELDTTDDTHTYMNGTAVFKGEIKSPCKGGIKSEKYDRGQWMVQALNRNVEDVCSRLWDPMSPLFPYFYDQPRCPITIGTKMTWKKRLLMIPRQIPPSFRGEWRSTMILEGKINGTIQRQCLRIRYDIFEYSN